MCDKKYMRPNELKRHIRSIHAGEVFTCSLCGKTFNREDVLKAHQLKTHGMVMCKFCESGFTNRTHLKDHVEKYHLHSSHY